MMEITLELQNVRDRMGVVDTLHQLVRVRLKKGAPIESVLEELELALVRETSTIRKLLKELKENS